jgi:hypothetical protein
LRGVEVQLVHVEKYDISVVKVVLWIGNGIADIRRFVVVLAFFPLVSFVGR